VGTQQRYSVVAVRCRSLAFFKKYKNSFNLLKEFFVFIHCISIYSIIFATASPTRPAPDDSSRVGTQQRYLVVAVRCRSLAILKSSSILIGELLIL